MTTISEGTNMRRHHQQGFTLIELMIVVAIIGILASLAYPAYRDSILKGKRAQARVALVELLQQQERYMTQRNCYVGFTTSAAGATTPSAPSPATACGGVTPPSAPFKAFSADTVANSAYLLSASACPSQSIAECVRVTATPIQASSDPKIGNLQMTSTGLRTCTGTSADANGVSKLCWP